MQRKSILESPWYWVYVFCTAAIVGLVFVGPKITERTVQNERSHQGRVRAAESEAGMKPDTAMSTRTTTTQKLTPYYLALAATIILSWVILWWRHFRYRRQSHQA